MALLRCEITDVLRLTTAGVLCPGKGRQRQVSSEKKALEAIAKMVLLSS